MFQYATARKEDIVEKCSTPRLTGAVTCQQNRLFPVFKIPLHKCDNMQVFWDRQHKNMRLDTLSACGCHQIVAKNRKKKWDEDKLCSNDFSVCLLGSGWGSGFPGQK